MGCAVEELTLKDGRAIAQNRTALLTALVGEGMSAEGTIKPGKLDDERRQASYGAHFCEVRVNATTGEVRVNRFVSTFAAGRILNEKTARSQCIGGIVFGIGAALGEELVHDPRSGRVVNHDLAEYHVPVNADVPHIEVHFLPERDQFANPLQSKGLGELGISGAGAAIANAIYNATGVRVRDYPLTLDKLLAGLPAV
jgi:xanthine dehydrogenase YagR molybdenum-binding subunit